MTKTTITSDTPARKRLPLYLAIVVAFAIMVLPIVTGGLLIHITGAHLLDGLFGIYRNTPFQRTIIDISGLLVLSAPILSLIFSIVFARKRKDLSQMQRFAPLIAIALTLIIAVVCSIGGGLFFG